MLSNPVTPKSARQLLIGQESVQIADYLHIFVRVCGRVPTRRTAGYGRWEACRRIAMNSGFSVRAGDYLCLDGSAFLFVVR